MEGGNVDFAVAAAAAALHLTICHSLAAYSIFYLPCRASAPMPAMHLQIRDTAQALSEPQGLGAPALHVCASAKTIVWHVMGTCTQT